MRVRPTIACTSIFQGKSSISARRSRRNLYESRVSIRPCRPHCAGDRWQFGIGLAIARALGLAGAAVILVPRRADELVDAAAALSRDDIAAQWVSCDLAQTSAIS